MIQAYSRIIERLPALLISVLLVAGIETVGAQGSGAVGQPIVDLIAELRNDGFRIVYSTDVLDESITVREPLQAAAPLARLDEALHQHAMALRPGPEQSWLVVADGSAAADEQQTDQRGPGASLTPERPAIEQVVVSASRYAFARSTAASQHLVDRRQLESAPVLGEDALRTTHALPGLTSSGLTARVNVRGGETDEALLLLDGVRLYSPYHMRDFQSLFGSISPRVIDSIDVRTGGFPADFGDRMSAVIEMQSVAPSERRHYEIGVSTLSTSVLSSGTFADDRGTWLTSLRRGNLDLLIDAADSDFGRPQYSDFFNKLTFALSDDAVLTTGALSLDDKISLNDAGIGTAGADYDDNYLWLRLDIEHSARLTGRYLLSRTDLSGTRRGEIDEPDVVTGELNGARTFSVATLRADWSLRLSDTQLLRWGLELEDSDAHYRFAISRTVPYPITAPDVTQPGNLTASDFSIEDRQKGIHASYRIQPTDRLTAELGLRWDAQSYLDESQTSPRLSLMLDVGSRTTLRASWGRFHQAQGLDELQVGDGLVEPFPAQSAEHYVLSFEYLLRQNMTLRVETYFKEFEHLRPRFENLFSRVSLLPEILPDRAMITPTNAEATGIELGLTAERDGLQWWLNVSRSSARDRLGDRLAKRSWEERWSAKGGAIWSGARWTASAALTMRSGWPITSLELAGAELRAGPFNDTTLGRFRTVDLRGSRTFPLARGEIELFMELTNAFDYANPCCVDYTLETDTNAVPTQLIIDHNNWLPAVPSFGFLWQF